MAEQSHSDFARPRTHRRKLHTVAIRGQSTLAATDGMTYVASVVDRAITDML